MKFEDSWENNTHQDVEDAIKDKVEEIEGRIDDVGDSVPDTETIEAIRQAAQDAQDAAAAVGDIINENSGRVSHAKAPAVVLRYIHQNGTDDMSLDDLNAGDVYADAGGSLELVVIENGSKTVKNIGTIDKGLIFYSIREEGFFRYLGSAAWELLSQGGEEEQEGTFAELDVDSRLKHIQSPVMVLDCISQSEEPGIADCPIGGYYCYMGNQASACRIRYRKAKVTAGQYEDIDLSSPQGHVLYYNKAEDKTYHWDGQKLVAVLWHAGLAIDNRLMSSRATAVVLRYISANLDDGETPMGANSGDVYCDSNNHIIVRGGTVNPDKEYVTAASLPTTPDADLGLPDQKLVYYDVNKKGFYRWNGVEWKKALNIDIDTTNLVTFTQLNNTLSSYATKNEMSVSESNGVATIQVKANNSTTVYTKSKSDALLGGKQDTLQFDTEPTANSQKMVKSGDIYTALQNLLSNISIGANGNWYIGSTDTTVKARGVDGITVSDPEDIQAVHDLNGEPDENFDPETQVAVLGADVGPMIQELIEDAAGIDASVYTAIKDNVNAVVAKVNALLAATGLANIAFVGTRPAAIPELVWPDGGDSPVLNSPQNGDEVNVGTIANDGTSVTKTITIKGKNLESAVNLVTSGNGFSLSSNSVSAAEANAGTTVIITYMDSGTGDGLDKTGTLTVSSAGSEFTQRTVTLKAKKLAPGVVEPVVSLAPNEYLELTGSLSGETYSGVLSVKSAYSSTKGLPFPEDISAVMGGASKAITYDDSTGAITVSGVTTDVTITAVASVVDGVDYQNNPIRWKEGLYFNGNGSYNNQGDNTSTDAEWCISDFVKCDWNNLSIGNLMFGTGVGSITDHYIIFYDENKQYHCRLSLNKAYRLYDLSNETGIVYFRISMLINKRSTRIIRDLTNERFLLKGSGYDGRYDDLVYGIAHSAPSNTPTDYQSDSYAVTQALHVNFGPGETITFWCGSLQNINGSYPYLFFYSQESIDEQYRTDKLSCSKNPRSWENSTSNTLPYASITLFLESIDDCYCKVTRNSVDTFYFAGFNVNTNGNA